MATHLFHGAAKAESAGPVLRELPPDWTRASGAIYRVVFQRGSGFSEPWPLGSGSGIVLRGSEDISRITSRTMTRSRTI
jgi:hypothetical protein